MLFRSRVVQERLEKTGPSDRSSEKDRGPTPTPLPAVEPILDPPAAPPAGPGPEHQRDQPVGDGSASEPIQAADWSLINLHGTCCVSHARQERQCVEELSKAGMLVRIKSPDKMGKSTLMARVIEQVREQGYRSAVIDLSEANQEVFTGINPFLQWFCAYAADQLDVSADPLAGWKSFLGANPNATKYVERELLQPFETPLVLAIDNFDRIFTCPGIETDFCGLLRGWFEKVNTTPLWEIGRAHV